MTLHTILARAAGRGWHQSPIRHRFETILPTRTSLVILQYTTEVLFVEDSAGDVLLTGQILADAPRPVKLHIARDGVQALSILGDRSFEPALIVVDLSLPGLSGFEVLERNPRKDIPVVVFSASINKAEKERAFALGAVGYVQKPMDLQAYREAVLGMIDRWALRGQETNGAATR